MNRPVVEQMKLFLEPRSVALIGVPRRTGRASFNILETLLEVGFPGLIYPVNPHADSILGLRAYPTVTSLPRGIELAVVMLPRHLVLGAIEDCIDRGIKAIIIFSEGFAEADEEGRTLQAQLVARAGAAGVRLVGPNTVGVLNKFYNFCSSVLPPSEARTPIAMVSQSGGMLEGFSDFSVGKGIDLGNMCDVDFADALEYLEQDADIAVIALHIEGMKNGARFLEVASRVGRRKPVLVLKTGRSASAAAAAASHTGSLAGQYEVLRAALRQAGLMPVEDVEELSDAARAFLYLPALQGNRVGLLTPTGGGVVMALDALERHGLERARLSPHTVERLQGFFTPWAQPRNPVDMMTAGMSYGYGKVYRACLEALLEDEGVDGVFCAAGKPTLKTIRDVCRGREKPVVAWMQGRWEGDSWLREQGYQATYPSPERAVRALAFLWDYHLTGKNYR